MAAPSSDHSLALPATAILAIVAGYNFYFFNHPMGGYDNQEGLVALGNLAAGLPGLLFSPARGLFIYFPATMVVLGLLVRQPRLLGDSTAVAAVGAILLTIVLFGTYSIWWAGRSYGPRYLSEIEPLILLLLGLAWQGVGVACRRLLVITCFGVLLAYSILVQAVGVYSVSALKWNQTPVDVIDAPSASGTSSTTRSRADCTSLPIFGDDDSCRVGCTWAARGASPGQPEGCASDSTEIPKYNYFAPSLSVAGRS
jgi:hypothetical protein